MVANKSSDKSLRSHESRPLGLGELSYIRALVKNDFQLPRLFYGRRRIKLALVARLSPGFSLMELLHQATDRSTRQE